MKKHSFAPETPRMDFHQCPQIPQLPGGKIPDGFALIPLPIFTALANQLPLHFGMPMANIATPPWNDSLYERAMSRSNN